MRKEHLAVILSETADTLHDISFITLVRVWLG